MTMRIVSRLQWGVFQAYDEDCSNLTMRSVAILWWALLNPNCMVGQTLKVFLLETLNFYKFIFLLPSCSYTSAVSFGSEGSLFKFYSLHPPPVYHTHRRSADLLIYQIEWICCIIKNLTNSRIFGDEYWGDECSSVIWQRMWNSC